MSKYCVLSVMYYHIKFLFQFSEIKKCLYSHLTKKETFNQLIILVDLKLKNI